MPAGSKTWSAQCSKSGVRERRLIIRPHSKATGPTEIDVVTLGDEACLTSRGRDKDTGAVR